MLTCCFACWMSGEDGGVLLRGGGGELGRLAEQARHL